MARKSIDLVGREEAARRLKAEEDAAAKAAKRIKEGPDLRAEECADCGVFGPWGDGEFNYCAAHVPRWLRYLDNTRKQEAREAE